MRKRLEEILHDSESKIRWLREKLEDFEKDPMILVKEVFTDGDLLLPILIQRFGDEALLEMQEYWYRFFLPKFKSYFGIDEISFSYDKTIYPAPIHVHIGEEVIALIDIVTHQYERVESEAVLQAKERIRQIETQREEVEKELEEKEPALRNPLVLGGANPLKLIDISIRQKKYKKEALEDVRTLQEEFFNLEKDKLRLQSELEQFKRMNLERDYVLDRIERRLLQLPGYTHTSGEASFTDTEEIEGLERRFSL